MYFLLGIFTCLFSALSSSATANSSDNNNNANPIRCKDPSGANIDWFLVYKLPKIKESHNPLIAAGLGFTYILPGSSDWILSTKGINDTDSIVGLTIQPLFNKDKTTQNSTSTSAIAYIAYNDQPPIGPTTDTGGHTKGIILTSGSGGGIFLQHSVPHFPLLDRGNLRYSYPHTGLNNGQIFNCLSLGSLGEVDNIGNILEVTKPHVYNFSMPDDIAKSLPILERILHLHPKKEEDSRHNGPDADHKIIQIQNAGRTLYSFAKGPSFHEEIYSDWIGPKFQTELDVQSWLNGVHPYPSNCTSSTFKVFNIQDKEVGGNKFATHNDHAKWAISTQQPIICIGDLNRMEHQTKRGGMVNCFTDKTVWKAFKKSVVSTQPCPRSTRSKINRKMPKYYL